MYKGTKNCSGFVLLTSLLNCILYYDERSKLAISFCQGLVKQDLLLHYMIHHGSDQKLPSILEKFRAQVCPRELPVELDNG